MKMKSFNLKDRFRIPFRGTVFKNAVCLGDCNGDGNIELLVGNTQGNLAIFRGFQPREPWKQATGLGTITGIRVGDIRNDGSIVVVVVNSEGLIHLFDLALYPDDLYDEDGFLITEKDNHIEPQEVIDLSEKVEACKVNDVESKCPESNGTTNVDPESEKEASNANCSQSENEESNAVVESTILENNDILVSQEVTPDVESEKPKSPSAEDLADDGDIEVIEEDVEDRPRSPSIERIPESPKETSPISEDSKSDNAAKSHKDTESGNGSLTVSSLTSSTPPSESKENSPASGAPEPSAEVPKAKPASPKPPPPKKKKIKGEIGPFYRQQVPPNIREVLVFDINNDGLNEVVVALTDRIVRTYQWRIPKYDLGRPGAEFCLYPMLKWESAQQIGSITENKNRDGSNTLIVAQTGGSMFRLTMTAAEDLDPSQQSEEEVMERMGEIDFKPLKFNRNFTASAEIQVGLKTAKAARREAEEEAAKAEGGADTPASAAPTPRPDTDLMPFALVTTDGTVVMANEKEMLWSLNVSISVVGVLMMIF